MTGWASFPRTIAFAAGAALAAPFAIGLLQPVLGATAAVSLYAIATSALYVAGLAQRSASRLGAALALALPATGLWLAGARPAEIAVACAALLGVLRSGWLLRDRRHAVRFARAFAIEATLAGLGLLVAAALGGGASFPVAFAVWGFFLVQSAFFLIGGADARRARTNAEPRPDPFDEARRRAAAVLDDLPC